MNKEKLKSLIKYAEDVKARLNSGVPIKHAHAPKEYKEFLTKELKMINIKIESLRMASENGK